MHTSVTEDKWDPAINDIKRFDNREIVMHHTHWLRKKNPIDRITRSGNASSRNDLNRLSYFSHTLNPKAT